jgi:hypothetical protein
MHIFKYDYRLPAMLQLVERGGKNEVSTRVG